MFPGNTKIWKVFHKVFREMKSSQKYLCDGWTFLWDYLRNDHKPERTWQTPSVSIPDVGFQNCFQLHFVMTDYRSSVVCVWWSALCYVWRVLDCAAFLYSWTIAIADWWHYEFSAVDKCLGHIRFHCPCMNECIITCDKQSNSNLLLLHTVPYYGITM